MLITKNRLGQKCNREKFSVSHFNLCIWKPAGLPFALQIFVLQISQSVKVGFGFFFSFPAILAFE